MAGEIEKSVQEIDDVVSDATGDINELKGILSEALGGLPFKVGIIIVVLYQISYLTYKAFFETRLDIIIQDDCYCDQRDQIVYRTITFAFMSVWLLFLSSYAIYNICCSFTCTDSCCRGKSESKKIEKLFEKYNSQIEKRKEYLLKELNDMITTYYLDNEHYRNKKEQLQNKVIGENARNLNQGNLNQENLEEVDAKSNETNWKKWCSCTKNCCFMLLKITFITIRFGFRLTIIPLLALHGLNNYAWNCIFNNLIRQYCATITNEYFIGLDHLLVVYAMYIFILVAILFSIIIEWFPRGIPSFILKFERNFNSLTINVEHGKRTEARS